MNQSGWLSLFGYVAEMRKDIFMEEYLMPEIKSVNGKTFEEEVTKSKVPILVDFWTPQCVPCKSVSVFLEKLYQSEDGNLEIIKVNAEESPELAKRLGVRGVPTLMLFNEGKAIGTRTGVLLPHEIRQWISSCLPE